MINQEQIENATVWELQNQLEFFQHDIQHAENWLKELKQARSVLRIALQQKSDKPERIDFSMTTDL